MARSISFFGAAVAAGALVAGFGAPVPAGAQTTAKAGYIVVFRDSVNSDKKADEIEQQEGFRSEFRYRHAVQGLAAQLTSAQAARLARDPEVAFLTPDQIVQAVGAVPLASGDTAPTGVRRIEAATTTMARQASTVNVAVIDTGVDLTHPDLNAVSGTNCVRSGSSAQDDNGHGTHVSGTIAAKNNGSGVVGVVPGTRIYAVKVLNATGSGTWSQVICGIDWVTANASALNIKVVNMSLGGSGTNDNNCGNTNFDALHKAICNSVGAGVNYAIAAGNSGTDFAGSSPANYPEVLTVTAMSDSDGQGGGVGGAPTCRTGEADDKYATFSNYAAATTEINHTIAAPGVCTDSTWLSGGYNTISGTSMATPHMAGSVALCYGDGGAPGPCTGLSPAQVIQKLRTDAANHTNGTPGYGFVGDPVHQPTTGKYFGYLGWDGAAPSADFSLSAGPSSQSVTQGNQTSYTLTVTPFNGYTGVVTLSVGCPAGATCTASPASVTPAATSTLTVATTTSTPSGPYTLTVTGSDGTISHSSSVALVVNAPAQGDFSLSASPTSQVVPRGSSTNYAVTVTSTNGFTGSVSLAVSGCPPGATCTFATNPVPSGSTLTVATTMSTPPGTSTLTITGTSGPLTHSTSVTLQVKKR